MDEFTQLLAALVAVSSIVGGLVAADQLTQRARMRRLAEWAKTLAKEEKGERKEVLLELERKATGRALATVLVPARHLPLAAMQLALGLGLALVSLGWWRLEGFTLNSRMWMTDYHWTTALPLIFGYSIAVRAVQQGLRLYRVRRRIGAEYARARLASAEVRDRFFYRNNHDLIEQVEDHNASTSEWRSGMMLVLECLAIGLGFMLARDGMAAAVSAPDLDQSGMPPYFKLGLCLLVGGWLALILSGARVLRMTKAMLDPDDPDRSEAPAELRDRLGKAVDRWLDSKAPPSE